MHDVSTARTRFGDGRASALITTSGASDTSALLDFSAASGADAEPELMMLLVSEVGSLIHLCRTSVDEQCGHVLGNEHPALEDVAAGPYRSSRFTTVGEMAMGC